MAAEFELRKSKNNTFTYHLKLAFGQILFNSPEMPDKDAAISGIEACKQRAADDANYERKKLSTGAHYFLLKSADGQVLGRSELYSSPKTLENGVEQSKSNTPGAKFEDKES
jgi:uncharacterized protein YegP (UPF0339 family)